MKTIHLDDEAYKCLASRKREDEDFSEVVKRLTNGRSLLELAGILSNEEADQFMTTIEASRKQSQERSDEIARRFEEF